MISSRVGAPSPAPPRNETALASISRALPPLPPSQAEAPNQHDTDTLFAEELNKLSIQERDEVLYDVHGVSDVIQEGPDMTANALYQMRAHLDAIPEIEKQAYLVAVQMNEAYVHDHDFLLMFLRADRFQAEYSAARLVSFFEAKLELFGPERLGREIHMDDLDDDDLACLESGFAQVLDSRDRAGRAVLFLLPMIRKHKTLENKLRTIFMVLMFALKDEETQKRGVVGVAYNVGREHTKDREAVWKAAKIVSILPIRFMGVHYCFDDENLRLLFSLAMFVFNKNARIRCRLHCGTDMECIWKLMTFGIPGDTFPVTPSGEKKIEAHLEFVQTMRRYGELKDGVKRIILPGKYDVLLGRGKPLQKHPGNLNYHCVVETYHVSYERAMKLEKTQLAKQIVDQIHEQGGRFLKQDEVGWVEIDEEAARTKISHTFRNHRIAARTALKKASGRVGEMDSGSANGIVRKNNPKNSNSLLGGRMSPGMVLNPTVDSKRRRVCSATGAHV